MTEPLLENWDLDADADRRRAETLEMEHAHPSRKFPFASESSLMFHQSIPHVAVAYAFPVILLLATILFLTSNLSIGASVQLLVTNADSGGSFASEVPIYSFSLASTIGEMARAGVYFLMVLILFCSGVWPYVKLSLLMYSWMASSKRLPLLRRERILYLIDSLGKFSLVDAYVLVLMMVAFRYHLEILGVEADVYVTPQFGFYAFLVATIISLVAGHVMLYLHRRTMIPIVPVYSGRAESLGRHIFDDKHNGGLVKLTRRFRRTVVAVIFLSILLILIGANLRSFHFEFDGAAGAVLGNDGGARIRKFSLVGIGRGISTSVPSPSFGIRWIQTCYFFFALVMPLLCLKVMLVLFVVPMTMARQRALFVVAEVMNAWSAIEVFMLAIVASLIEIDPFSESMVGERCKLLDKLLVGLSADGAAEGIDKCFGITSSIDGGVAVLVLGVLLNSMVVSMLHRLAHHAMWERIEREDRPNSSEEETRVVRESVRSHVFVSRLRRWRFLGSFMFEDISFGPTTRHNDVGSEEEEVEFEHMVENHESESENFWTEWRKIVSVI